VGESAPDAQAVPARPPAAYRGLRASARRTPATSAVGAGSARRCGDRSERGRSDRHGPLLLARGRRGRPL